MNTQGGNMSLFGKNRVGNLLHEDGTVNYYGKVLISGEADQYFDLLMQNILWENDEVVIFGKHIVTKRKAAWHGDSEKSLGTNNTIASLSFGAERKFLFKHKQTKQTVSLVLEHGSLLIMRDATQANWLHSLPKSKDVTRPRINLTFRTILEP